MFRAAAHVPDLGRIRGDPNMPAGEQIAHSCSNATFVNRRRVDLRTRRSCWEILGVIAHDDQFSPRACGSSELFPSTDFLSSHQPSRKRDRDAVGKWETTECASDGPFDVDL